MKIPNPFKLQNWKFKKFLIVILFFQISLLGLFALNNLGVDTPIIRPLVGFIYLMIIPGYLLLRILKLHNLNNIESFLYAIGLSLFLNMFAGFLINIFYPLLGITDKPIAEIPIILTMALVVGTLSIVAYIRDRDYEDPDYLPIGDIINPQVLFLSLIPFMAIFGTYLVNYYNNNILLMVMIVIIALVCLIVGFTNWINEKYYPYVIWIMAISLLCHITLITPYAVNHDGEMVGAKVTVEDGFWNPQLYGNYNSIIITKIFTPMIYFICNISLTWVYKILFPILFSIIPIIIYSISNKYLDYKKSFFSALIFIISGGAAYVSAFTVITKQAMATLFVSLMINAVINKKLLYNIKLILSTIFGLGIIFSHYGTTYLVLFGLVVATVVLSIVPKLMQIGGKNTGEFRKIFIITLLYVLLAISWYIYISGASVVASILNIGITVFNSIWDEFLSPQSSRGAYMLTKNETGLYVLLKYINLSVIFLIILGILKYIKEHKKLINDMMYISLSLYFLWILVLSVILPYFAVMSPGRLYILGLITLSLFCVIGVINLLQIIYGILKIKRDDFEKDTLKFLSIYLSTLILFNTGFIWEITYDSPNSIALSKYSINTFGTLEDKAKFYSRYIMEYDVYSIKWLSSYCKKDTKVYYTAGYTSIASLPYNYGSIHLRYKGINRDSKSLPNGSYIWLLYANTKENIGFGVLPGVHWFDWYEFNRSKIYPFTSNSTNKIYTDGGSQVLWVS